MPRTEEQFEEIREARRQQIMDAALELFGNEGYYTTSISKIAAKAGISKGLMYNYFTGKEELVKAIIHEGFEQIMNTFDPNKDGILTDEELVYFLEENFRLIKENIAYWKLYYAVMMQPAVYKLVVEEYTKVVPELLKVFTEFFRKRGAEKPELEALYFGALMDGICFNFVLSPEIFPIEEMKKFILKKIHESFKHK